MSVGAKHEGDNMSSGATHNEIICRPGLHKVKLLYTTAAATQGETLFRAGLHRVKLYVGWATQSETKSRLGLYAESENVSVFLLFFKLHKNTKKNRRGSERRNPGKQDKIFTKRTFTHRVRI